MRAVITGGGTAGHVLPALAIAEGLLDRGIDADDVLYVGAQRGIETRLVPPTGLAHELLDVVGLQRELSRRNLAFVPRMWSARRRAIDLLGRFRPDVVVSVGGYASMPSVFAAGRLGIPVVVVSYDLLPGRASRLAARGAAACAVAFPDSPLPRATVTGAPVRRAILAVDRRRDRAAARHALGVPANRFLLAVMGGSQGSGALNTAIDGLLERHATDRSLAVRHVVGERFLDGARPPTSGDDGVLYQPVGYEPEMAHVYAAADLLVGRGGASTVHEVAVTGIPAVLVPWAGSAEDHQTLNVRWLADEAAAVHLPEADIDQLDDVVHQLRFDHEERAAIAANAREMGEVHRSGALADLIIEVAAR